MLHKLISYMEWMIPKVEIRKVCHVVSGPCQPGNVLFHPTFPYLPARLPAFSKTR
jgi:hypothetical protein